MSNDSQADQEAFQSGGYMSNHCTEQLKGMSRLGALDTVMVVSGDHDQGLVQWVQICRTACCMGRPADFVW